MKKIKILAIIFAITCVLSLNNVKAGSQKAFLNFQVKARQGVSQTSAVKKTTKSAQYIKGYGAYDNLSGDGRAIQVKVTGSGQYYDIIDDKYKNIDPLLISNQIKEHTLDVKAKSWTLSTATASFLWILDDYLIS